MEKINLRGARETLLATLYGRAMDYRSAKPVLADRIAAEAVEALDYDFSKMKMTPTTAAGVAIRGKQLDDWTAAYLAEHPEVTVLHLACGMDTRVHRLGPQRGVRWFDVDYPDVIELRKRVLPEVAGADYRMIGASVTDDGWLAEIPDDRPAVAVFEGLSMYLPPADGRRLIQRITGHFPSGQLLFDCYGSIGIKLQKLVPAVRNAGATLHWGIDDPHEIERLDPRLRCLDAIRSTDFPGNDKLPLSGRISLRVMSAIPVIRDVGRALRYQF